MLQELNKYASFIGILSILNRPCFCVSVPMRGCKMLFGGHVAVLNNGPASLQGLEKGPF
jgi:hypothetical protein